MQQNEARHKNPPRMAANLATATNLNPASLNQAAPEQGIDSSRRRIEAMVERMARMEPKAETLAEIAHDSRNLVTALALYCDLLEEPGVLKAEFRHYAGELRLVASACRRLVEQLSVLEVRMTGGRKPVQSEAAQPARRGQRWEALPPVPVADLAQELMANRNLLSALAGPGVAVSVQSEGGHQPVAIHGEDLTRILVNLVKNATEAMPRGGRITIGLKENADAQGQPASLVLSVEDSGQGIPQAALEKIFEAGYSTRAAGAGVMHRGLGLSITRSIVEASGGRIFAANRAIGGSGSGARFEIEFPVAGR